jgi:hypothetical protein
VASATHDHARAANTVTELIADVQTNSYADR